jgi:Kef-type K+ transport system membrane component KefB
VTSLWLDSALWIGLALVAALLSIRIVVSVALIEIVVGCIAGNLIGLDLAPWVNFLAGLGAILLTFLAGTEVDLRVIRRNLGSTVSIGVLSFLGPYLGVMLFVHYALAWPWPEAQIAGIALSTTSVAVVYAVMIETGYNRTELGKIILAACFITDLGTVLALGIVFARVDAWLAAFGAATALALWLSPRIAPWFFRRVGHRLSDPQAKFVVLALLGLGGLANLAGSEAVLPAYLLGMALAPSLRVERDLAHRLRVIVFTLLTPIYFLKAGSLVDLGVGVDALLLFGILLAIKMVTKFLGVLPMTMLFRFGGREGMYTTLLMSTGLTFGTISALFGLTNGIIDQGQYTVLVAAVIGSALVPTMIAQRWFQPAFEPIAEEARVVPQDSDR